MDAKLLKHPIQKRATCEKGFAMLEALPMVFFFVVLLGFSFGFFGIIHTATLNTIAARTYAFETFRNRTDLRFFRGDSPAPTGTQELQRWSFHQLGVRIHGIASERTMNVEQHHMGVDRPLSLFMKVEGQSNSSVNVHNVDIFKIEENKRNTNVGVSPVWVKSQYGICLNAPCGN